MYRSQWSRSFETLLKTSLIFFPPKRGVFRQQKQPSEVKMYLLQIFFLLYFYRLLECTEGSRAEESWSASRQTGKWKKNGKWEGTAYETARNWSADKNRQDEKHGRAEKRNEDSHQTTKWTKIQSKHSSLKSTMISGVEHTPSFLVIQKIIAVHCHYAAWCIG